MQALISLGSNTTRFLVVREAPGGALEEVEQAQIGTRLGEGLREHGTFAPAAVERNLRAVRAYSARARELGAGLSIIATSAVRRASDAREFAERVRAAAGVPLEVIAGSLEAAASFRGATEGAGLGEARVAVLDVGGGSTECAVGQVGRLESAASFELGSVRVSERHPDLMGEAPGKAARGAAALARAEIGRELRQLAEFRPVAQVRCVAGTALTLAAVVQGTGVDRVSGSTLALADLDATLERLLDLTLAERRDLPGMLPQRADILAGGALILSEALRALGVVEAVLEANDLLLGYLLLRRRPSPVTE
jgi:exopolyphosphatase/guanosine-5'-triphosphate,3'-diphosphate pyrophosphatase